METLTQNAQATSAPVSSTPTLSPASKAEGERLAKQGIRCKALQTNKPMGRKEAVEIFTPQPLTAVKGLTVVKQGQIVNHNDGTTGIAARSVMVLKSLKWFKDQREKGIEPYKGKTDAELQALRVELGRKQKPEAMGRVSTAASDNSFILHKYTERRAKKSNLFTVGIELEQVNVPDKVRDLMTATGKSEAACRKFLGLPAKKHAVKELAQ